ncbi:MAG: hypothetical protein AAFU73_18985 [Planctomycetota bacterium]
MRIHPAARTAALAFGIVLAGSASGQDELDGMDEFEELDEDALFDEDDLLGGLDDELDALLSGDLSEAGAADGVVTGFQGFVALEPRVYLKDRGGVRNDEQFLAFGELELDLRFSDDVTGYLRPRFLVDLLDGDYERFQPFEAYVTWESERYDVRVGSIVENWGIVDTFNPVDVINRRDFASDLLDADRLGEFGVRARAKLEGAGPLGEPTLSAYVLPVWQATPFAPEDQRFAIGTGDGVLDGDRSFDPRGEDRLFAGLRGQATLSTAPFNADVQAVVAHGPGRFPAVGVVGGAFLPVYYGATTIGAGVRAVPNEAALGSELAKYTLKAEIAHTRTDAYDDAPVAAPDDWTVLVVGVDRVFDGVVEANDSLTATVEYASESGASDEQSVFRPFRNDLVARLFWEANDFERTSLELRGIFDLDVDETVAELIYETQLRRFDDDLKFTLQAQFFDPAGATESLFGLFPNNTSILAGLRWDF